MGHPKHTPLLLNLFPKRGKLSLAPLETQGFGNFPISRAKAKLWQSLKCRIRMRGSIGAHYCSFLGDLLFYVAKLKSPFDSSRVKLFAKIVFFHSKPRGLMHFPPLSLVWFFPTCKTHWYFASCPVCTTWLFSGRIFLLQSR